MKFKGKTLQHYPFLQWFYLEQLPIWKQKKCYESIHVTHTTEDLKSKGSMNTEYRIQMVFQSTV